MWAIPIQKGLVMPFCRSSFPKSKKFTILLDDVLTIVLDTNVSTQPILFVFLAFFFRLIVTCWLWNFSHFIYCFFFSEKQLFLEKFVM